MPAAGKPGRRLRWSNWNLLLALPFLGLVTPLFNRTDPTLGGWPFYYWGYLVSVLLGCACVGVTVMMTDDRRTARRAAARQDTTGPTARRGAAPQDAARHEAVRHDTEEER